MPGLNRSKFLNAVAERAGAHRRDVEHVWESALTVLRDSVKKGEDVSLPGFGKFKRRVTAARKAGMRKDPFTGEMRNFPARPAKKAPRFLPAKQFKEYVGGGLKSWPAANTRPMALAGDTTPGGRGGAGGGSAARSTGSRKATGRAATGRGGKAAARKTTGTGARGTAGRGAKKTAARGKASRRPRGR